MRIGENSDSWSCVGIFVFDLISRGVNPHRLVDNCWVAMALPTLYDMCQSQTIVNMRAGLWSQCQENPFTRVPPKLVDKLRESIFSMNFRQLPNREALLLLFTSHRVKKLDLSCFLVNTGETFSESDPYAPSHLKMDIDKKKKYSSMGFYYSVIIPDGTDVSTNLTEIHTCLDWFDLNVLMNYEKLRILRLHYKAPPRNFSIEFLEACEKVLPSLENLETFTICNSRIDCFGIRPLIKIALAHCSETDLSGNFRFGHGH
ncbi:hypothetical protein CEXT_343571 [Caerostris extrusa]|uniref:Uncharacterized protein n=1 Tax=Caerostris extrusa TaxID=172846 RepID=A0AAV4YBV4_CAEEX|nr:hypothetical protein CEXT_343571 [Caerostris extrusa]